MQDKVIEELIQKEYERQNNTIELIASENITSKDVMEACGSIFTNKYAEGTVPRKDSPEVSRRYYNGCEVVDEMEKLAVSRFQQLFKTDYHVNVQPHSGAQANMAVFMSVLEPGDTVLSMDLSNGGHLSHGSPVNFSGKYYNIVSYGIRENGCIDYQDVEYLASKHNPKLIICGASNYSKIIDFEEFGKIRDMLDLEYPYEKHYLLADIAHIAGLVAGDQHPSPFGIADFVTTTTHKSLRGPRGGVIACKEQYARQLDSAVFPGMQGGPLEHIIAGKAVCFGEALKPEFREYAQNIRVNAKVLCQTLLDNGIDVVGGMTENHLMTIDLRKFGLTGKEVTNQLEKAGITANKNTVPNDPQSPFVTSGIRIGVPAVTTRGMYGKDMETIGLCIVAIIKNMKSGSLESITKACREITQELCDKYPLYK